LSFKLELLQHAGSFKTRGAFANLLMRNIPKAGVVAASGGNHGAAVAYAAMKLGIPAKIFVPSISSPVKIQRIRDCGAELVVGGDRYADALAASEAWVAQSGALAVHAFDQRETLLGQGTIGLELEEQVPDLDTLLVSVGGGGLIGGIAAWYGRRVRVIGVEPEASPRSTMCSHLDVRRFRANIVVTPAKGESVRETDWLGGTLIFGDGPNVPKLRTNVAIDRCVMITIDPRIRRAILRSFDGSLKILTMRLASAARPRQSG